MGSWQRKESREESENWGIRMKWFSYRVHQHAFLSFDDCTAVRVDVNLSRNRLESIKKFSVLFL